MCIFYPFCFIFLRLALLLKDFFLLIFSTSSLVLFYLLEDLQTTGWKRDSKESGLHHQYFNWSGTTVWYAGVEYGIPRITGLNHHHWSKWLLFINKQWCIEEPSGSTDGTYRFRSGVNRIRSKSWINGSFIWKLIREIANSRPFSSPASFLKDSAVGYKKHGWLE